MHRLTAVILGCVAPLLAAAFCALDGRSIAAEDEGGAAHARQAWQRSCQKCHAVPDATFETGRAFLAQITETS